MPNWLDTLRQKAEEVFPESKKIEIPLFPLNSVLFPGGLLRLKVFEARYLDMASACLNNKTPFGACLISADQEAGISASPHEIGTTAHITEADMSQANTLMLKVHGRHRFRILSCSTQSNGLLNATVELFDESENPEMTAVQQDLLPLLKQIIDDLGVDKVAKPYVFDSAVWVGYRLAEALPIQPLAKQKLLELDDPIARLEIIHAYLTQHRLVK